MNNRIQELIQQSMPVIDWKARHGVELNNGERLEHMSDWFDKFAELIVEECRGVVADVYRNTPLELCGLLLTADEAIAKHFYGINNDA